MRLTVPEITLGVTSVRSTARLISADDDIELWYEAPVGWQIDRSSAPFVPVSTLLAASLGAETLVVDDAIPTPLLEGSRRAAAFIATHFGQPTPSIVAAERPAPVVLAHGRRVGLFFSRGVDSSANLVLADQGRLEPRPDTAIIITGIDPANDADLEARICAEGVRAAAGFGVDALVVGSNMRSVIDRHMLWIEGFGTVLAGIGLLLSRQFSDVIISSATPDQTFYAGSHPDLDPLWGNGAVAIHHLPADLERSERVRLIVEDGRPLEWLRVCWAGLDRNCGVCRKCLQTVALIEAYGGDPTGVFVECDVSPESIRRDTPGYILRPDFVASAPPHLAAAAAERLDAVDGRPAPAALHGAAGAAPNGHAEWLVVGPPGPETAVLVDAAMQVGPGRVLDDGATLTTHVLRRAAGWAGLTIWSAGDPVADGMRALECLRSGSRPLIVHRPGSLDLARATLPAAAHDLVGSADDIAEVLPRAGADMLRLARTLVGGAVGWVQAT